MTQLVVFDVDGTLVDSAALIVGAMERACDARGLPFVGARAMLRTVGLPLKQSIPMLYADITIRDRDALIAAYSQAYRALRQAPDSPETLFAGVRTGLERLRDAGRVLAVATGKSMHGLEATLQAHGLSELFASLHASDQGPGKPDPFMLHSAMTAARSASEHTVMVGDTTYDVQMAKRAGVRAVAVAWGHHGVDELRHAGAEAVVESFAELVALLLREPAGDAAG